MTTATTSFCAAICQELFLFCKALSQKEADQLERADSQFVLTESLDDALLHRRHQDGVAHPLKLLNHHQKGISFTQIIVRLPKLI
jgi:hypothetical protein